MRISEKEGVSSLRRSGLKARVSDVRSGDQLLRAFAVDRHQDARIGQRQVGDVDPAGQQRQEAQARGQPRGMQRRLALAVAERHVRQHDLPIGKQRDRDVAAQNRIEPGGGTDFGLDRLADLVLREQERHHGQRAEHAQNQDANGKTQALEASDR